MIIQLLGIATTKPNSDKYASYYVYVLAVLSYLTDVMPFNQQKLSSIGSVIVIFGVKNILGLVGDIIDSFQKILFQASK